MTENHPLTPPPELVQQWNTEGRHQDYCTVTEHVATQAAKWGADMELEACCDWLKLEGHEYEHEALLAARRPKPPSLKEQALKALDDISFASFERDAENTIRRALEQLPE